MGIKETQYKSLDWDVDDVVNEIIRRDQNFIVKKIKELVTKYMGKTILYDETTYNISNTQDVLFLPRELRIKLWANL